MKKRVWVASPVFYLIVAAMLAMAGYSLRYSQTAFIVEGTIALASLAAVAVAIYQFHAHVVSSVNAAHKVLTDTEYRSLREFTMPLAVVGAAGDIIWINDAFLADVTGGRECRGENILRFLYPNTLEQVAEATGVDVALDNKHFSAYTSKTEYGYIVYFVDDTYYKAVNEAYTAQRPVVAIAHFDNREELARDASGGEDARIASEVEGALGEWAQNMGGFLKRLSGGRYLILTTEEKIQASQEKRFEILDAVRNIKLDGRRSATISVGVGRGADTLLESEQWARKALDMALGRGGDQVAIKQKNDTYSFFGGLSKGVEKRDKVRTRVIAATVSDHVKASDNVLIMGHKFSDLDAVGSAVGLWSAVTKGMQKSAYIVINRQQSLAGPVIRAIDAENEGKKVFMSPMEALALVTGRTLLIVVDCHSPDFVESRELLDALGRVMVVDHHRMMVKHIENSIVFYHEQYASSASEMVTELVQYLQDNTLSQTEAEALLAGIMLDTKNFVLKTGVRTFEAAAYLRRRGADTVEVKRMFSDNITTYKAKYQIVSSVEIINECAISQVEHEFPEVRVTAAQAADELLSIQGVKASFVIFPAGDVMNISARSLGDINVQVIMEKLGGGGHLTMAATQMPGSSAEQAKYALMAALQEMQANAMPKS